MKKIDRLLITSFIPPFFVAFLIAVFTLLMQTLWLYIDDIAGKGLGFFLIMELLGYRCMGLIPLALPIAILISSVMVLGNLAERYELSSFKSAGVSLLRIMRPLLIVGFVAALFSYYCSVRLIPLANLKFGSRMWDIQQQKPALRLDAGVFNYDFQGYAIHIKNKKGDGRRISDVLIYDHTEANAGRISVIKAREGEMFTTPDGRYFVMRLKDGHQYLETATSRTASNRSFPFVRVSFQQWTKVFDLSEFQLGRTDEELFKSNRSMMSPAQLKVAIDSLDLRILEREKGLANYVTNYFSDIPLDSTFLQPEPEPEPAEESPPMTDSVPSGQDSVPERLPHLTRPVFQTPPPSVARRYGPQPLEQNQEKEIGEYASILETFPKDKHRDLKNKAVTYCRSIEAQAESAQVTLDNLGETLVKHIYEMHTKYSMALVCFIFVFIGAPMGAIVRKGGFGYPILISIFFFMLFVILTIFCRKIAESFVVPAVAAAWIPCSVLLPMGVILTVKAMNDSKLFNKDFLANLLFRWFKKRRVHATTPA